MEEVEEVEEAEEVEEVEEGETDVLPDFAKGVSTERVFYEHVYPFSFIPSNMRERILRNNV